MSKKAKRGEHLRPMEPVIVPEAVIKKQPKEVQKLLKELNDLKDRSSAEGSKIRKSLRKLGFKLSDFRGEGNGKGKAKATEKKVEKKSKKKEAPEEQED